MNSLNLCFKSLIGISFITVIVEMILIDGNFKKYVKSVMGIIMTIIIIGSFVKLKDVDFDFSLSDSYDTPVTQTIEIDLNSEVKRNTEKNIRNKLSINDIEAKEIKVEFTNDYIIKKVEIVLPNTSKSEQSIINILVNDLQIDKERIVVTYDKEGDKP